MGIDNDTFRDTVGAVASTTSCVVVNKKIIKPISKEVAKSFVNCANEIFDYNEKNNNKLGNSLIEMYETSGLKEKGATVFDYQYGYPVGAAENLVGTKSSKKVQEKYKFETVDEFIDWTKKNPKKWEKELVQMEKKLKEAEENFVKYGTNDKKVIFYKKHLALHKIAILKQLMCLNLMDQAFTGENAFAKEKGIHVNMKNSLFASLPHELGHVSNNMSKGLGRVTSFSARLAPKVNILLFPILLGTAIFRDKKAEGEESKTIVGKSLDFIKDNCVGISALSQVPCLAEEGLASIKGLRMSKKYVAPQEQKMLKGFFKRAFGTYVVAAGAAVLPIFVANTIKNVICPPKEKTA